MPTRSCRVNDPTVEVLSTRVVQRRTTSITHTASINPATNRATVITAAVMRWARGLDRSVRLSQADPATIAAAAGTPHRPVGDSCVNKLNTRSVPIAAA
jgi:hypothetical protein